MISFNLNLLECKFSKNLRSNFSDKVLISTYWNVNEKIQLSNDYAVSVLISTYWNVNQEAEGCQTRAERFNLNLLECKLENRGLTIAREFGFNLNLLECKFIDDHLGCSIILHWCIYRVFWEWCASIKNGLRNLSDHFLISLLFLVLFIINFWNSIYRSYRFCIVLITDKWINT